MARLLDLYCGAGGAAVGYHRAGFSHITGIDTRNQPRYPFDYIQADALEYLAAHGHEYDAIHASPPCQAFVALAKVSTGQNNHPDLLTPTLAALQPLTTPWVVENVETAPMPATVILCGSSFNLKVRRHRKFASNIFIPAKPCQHKDQPYVIGVYGSGAGARGHFRWDPQRKKMRNFGRQARYTAEASDAMGGLDWMVRREMNEAVPPAYTEYIGRYLLEYITERA